MGLHCEFQSLKLALGPPWDASLTKCCLQAGGQSLQVTRPSTLSPTPFTTRGHSTGHGQNTISKTSYVDAYVKICVWLSVSHQLFYCFKVMPLLHDQSQPTKCPKISAPCFRVNSAHKIVWLKEVLTGVPVTQVSFYSTIRSLVYLIPMREDILDQHLHLRRQGREF